MVCTERVNEAAVCDIEGERLLLYSRNLNSHSYGIKVRVIVCEDSVSDDLIHTVDYLLRVLPRPRTEVLTDELNVGELILKRSYCDLGHGDLKITLENGKHTFMYIIIYIIIGVCDADLELTCARNEQRQVKLYAEKLRIFKALDGVSKLWNRCGIGNCRGGNRNGYGGLLYLIGALIDAEVVGINYLKAVFILTRLGACASGGYNVKFNILAQGICREVIISIVNKCIFNVGELNLLLIYGDIHEVVFIESLILIEGKSYAEALSSCISDGCIGGINEFPLSVLVGREDNIAERIAVGCANAGKRGILYLLENGIDLYTLCKVLAKIYVPVRELIACFGLGCGGDKLLVFKNELSVDDLAVRQELHPIFYVKIDGKFFIMMYEDDFLTSRLIGIIYADDLIS